MEAKGKGADDLQVKKGTVQQRQRAGTPTKTPQTTTKGTRNETNEEKGRK